MTSLIYCGMLLIKKTGIRMPIKTGGKVKRKNKDKSTFKKDLKNFAASVANHNRIIGEISGTYDTYKKGKKLAASGSKVIRTVKRRIKSRINRSVRNVQHYLS